MALVRIKNQSLLFIVNNKVDKSRAHFYVIISDIPDSRSPVKNDLPNHVAVLYILGVAAGTGSPIAAPWAGLGRQ